ncbi:MAG: type III PLP-dependent enzyme [Pseudomonadota bacterium]
MDNYKDARDVAARLHPENPVFCARPPVAEAAARWFTDRFPGETFYAVKANPALWLLDALHEGGVTRFEAASIAEVRLIAARFPDAEIAYMHPIKSAATIREAYGAHGVRIFALDTDDELTKILDATDGARDLTLCVRHGVSSDHAKLSLARKFGAVGAEAVALMRRTRQAAARLGVAFHVGSQAMAPAAFTEAIAAVEKTIVEAGVIVDVLDVGGGFPVTYPGMAPPPLEDFIAAIAARFEAMLVAENCALWCEPGRALSAEAASLLVRVEARKERDLYINDGAYGALFDAAHLNWPFPARLLGADDDAPEEQFSFYGPTCDDLDRMEGPFALPASVAAGDYLEIGSLGAYGAAMATGFNGFGGPYETVIVRDSAATGRPAPASDVANENELATVKEPRYGV